MKSLLLPIATILVLAGCGATGAKFSGFEQPSDGNSRVYVYRPSSFMGGGVHYDVHANEKLIGHIRNGGYFEKELAPGEYEIWGETEVKRGIKIQLSPDAIQCVRAKVGGGVMIGRPRFATVDMDQCIKEIVDTQLSSEKQERVN